MREWMWARFTILSDEPCSGADRLAPADSEADHRRSVDSGAGPPLLSGSRVALRSLGGLGTVP
jgi:hypothetical protein